MCYKGYSFTNNKAAKESVQIKLCCILSKKKKYIMRILLVIVNLYIFTQLNLAWHVRMCTRTHTYNRNGIYESSYWHQKGLKIFFALILNHYLETNTLTRIYLYQLCAKYRKLQTIKYSKTCPKTES